MDNLKANIVINARILDKFKGSVRIVDKGIGQEFRLLMLRFLKSLGLNFQRL